jgi:tetratricopeptide (TPR) repeat protein
MLPEDVQKLKDFDFTNKDIILCPYHYAHDEFGKSSYILMRERIIRRSLGLVWQEPIHESLPLISPSPVFLSEINIHHNKQHGTSERNLNLLERIVAKQECKVSRNIFYLGKEYMDFGRTDEGIKYLTMFTERSDAYWEDAYLAHYYMATAYMNQNDELNFKKHIFESIKLEDRRAEPYYSLGMYYQCKNQIDKAIQWFEMCLHVRRPKDLCAGYQPEYYSWLPALQLCVAYNSIGDIKKAYEYNRKVLEVRPQDSRAINNDRILKDALDRGAHVVRQDGKGKRLNLGCGNRPVPGYVNVDVFKGEIGDEVFELDNIPYLDNTIEAIHSEHALEHVVFDRAERAIKEWYRVLKPGGEVILYMPDFERCCQSYLAAPLEDPFFMKTRAWFKATVYGIQKGQAGEPDDAQVHKCGFSKQEIRLVMERNGFVVDSVENYGGPGQKPDYCTPSMEVRAYKPSSGLKVGWVGYENWEAAQMRIRVLNISKWFKMQGYRSDVVDYSDIIEKGYDIAVVGKGFDENHLNNIKILKQHGKIVIADICEDLIDWPYVNEILSVCDKVVCCSHALADKVRLINLNTYVIEDAWES